MFPGGITWDKNRQHMVEHRRGCHREIIIALKFRFQKSRQRAFSRRLIDKIMTWANASPYRNRKHNCLTLGGTIIAISTYAALTREITQIKLTRAKSSILSLLCLSLCQCVDLSLFFSTKYLLVNWRWCASMYSACK